MTDAELIVAFPWLGEVLRRNPAYLDELIKPSEFARLVGKSEATLASERTRGGPTAAPFVALGPKAKRYRRRHALELIARKFARLPATLARSEPMRPPNVKNPPAAYTGGSNSLAAVHESPCSQTEALDVVHLQHDYVDYKGAFAPAGSRSADRPFCSSATLGRLARALAP